MRNIGKNLPVITVGVSNVVDVVGGTVEVRLAIQMPAEFMQVTCHFEEHFTRVHGRLVFGRPRVVGQTDLYI
jgi:hypothetical protein